jgi:hypothetical protein
MDVSKYLEPVKHFSALLVLIAALTWKVTNDEFENHRLLAAARENFAEWIFYQKNADNLEAALSLDDEKQKDPNKIVVEVPSGPLIETYEFIGQIELRQIPGKVSIEVGIAESPKRDPVTKAFFNDNEAEKLFYATSNKRHWNQQLNPDKYDWLSKLYKNERESTVTDVLQAFITITTKQDVFGLSNERVTILKTEARARANQLRSMCRELGLRENGEGGEIKEGEEKVVVPRLYFAIEQFRFKKEYKIPVLEIELDPVYAIVSITTLALVSLIVIHSSTAVLLTHPRAGLAEPWPLVDSRDVLGRYLGFAWIMVISLVPVCAAACADGICGMRVLEGTWRGGWFVWLAPLSLGSGLVAVLCARKLRKLRRYRHLILDETLPSKSNVE